MRVVPFVEEDEISPYSMKRGK